MTTETILTDEIISELAAKHLWAHAQFDGAGEVLYEGEIEFARAIEQAVLQSEQVQALRKDAELYQKLRSICVTSTDFTGVMQPDEPERWCVLRRKDGVISSFTCDDLDHGIHAAMEQQK